VDEFGDFLNSAQLKTENKSCCCREADGNDVDGSGRVRESDRNEGTRCRSRRSRKWLLIEKLLHKAADSAGRTLKNLRRLVGGHVFDKDELNGSSTERVDIGFGHEAVGIKASLPKWSDVTTA